VTRIDAGSVEEFPEGMLRIISIQDREIGVLRWEGGWFALRNICPHLGGPVCAGTVRPCLTEETPWSGDLILEPDRPVLTCPWHFWEFDLRTGQSVTGRERIKTYPVYINAGRVTIEMPGSRVRAG
jgi:nitrite reductase/ring-hydroxylating ferredoxin subunit